MSPSFSTTISSPKSELHPISLQDIERYSDPKEKNFSESWSYLISLDSTNTHIELDFSLGGIGSIKKPVIGTSLYISNLKKQNYSVSREYPIQKYSFNLVNHKLSFHQKIWVQGKLPKEHQLYFETKKNGIHYIIQLKFSEIDTGFVWDNSFDKKRKTKKSDFKMSFLIPYSKVKGIVIVNQDTTFVEGKANLSHVYQNTGRIKNIDFLYRYFTKESNETGLFIKKRNTNKILGYAIKKIKNRYTLIQNQEFKILTSTKISNIKTPQTIQITPQIKHQLKTPIHFFSILFEFSDFKKYAIKKIMGGELIKFYGQGLSNNTPIFFLFSKNKK